MTRYVVAILAGLTLVIHDGPRLLQLAAALLTTNLILHIANRLNPVGATSDVE